MCRVIMGHLRVTVGHLRVTIGYLGSTMHGLSQNRSPQGFFANIINSCSFN